MSTTDTTPDTTPADTPSSEPVDITENYSTFKEVFNNTSKETVTPEADIGSDTPANDEGTDDEDLNEGSDGQDKDADEQPETEPQDKGKSKKPSAQERINEITRQRYEETRARQDAELRAEQLAHRLSILEASANNPQPKVAPAIQSNRSHLPPDAPNPDAVYADGTAAYPLGEYDPKFIFDLTQYSVDVKTREIEMQRNQYYQQQAYEQSLNQERQTVINKYQEKLAEYEEAVPEVREHITDLMTTFSSLEPQYGEYLATTIMDCNNGPAIMDYLSQNIDEARQIVASGPASATRAIGRLEAKLSTSTSSDRNDVVISDSVNTPPPPSATRGSSKGRAPVRPDTNDLAAFKREYFSK